MMASKCVLALHQMEARQQMAQGNQKESLICHICSSSFRFRKACMPDRTFTFRSGFYISIVDALSAALAVAGPKRRYSGTRGSFLSQSPLLITPKSPLITFPPSFLSRSANELCPKGAAALLYRLTALTNLQSIDFR